MLNCSNAAVEVHASNWNLETESCGSLVDNHMLYMYHNASSCLVEGASDVDCAALIVLNDRENSAVRNMNEQALLSDNREMVVTDALQSARLKLFRIGCIYRNCVSDELF